MKVAVICLILFGLIAAACAAVLIATVTRPTGPAAPTAANTEPQVDVLVAARELQPNSVVDSTAVIVKKVPKSQVPPSALLNPVQVVGKVLTDKMLADQAFTKSCFAREGTGVYLATAVPPGKRAMSITLTDWSGMAGLLYPGSVVDVLVSYKTLGLDPRRTETELRATTLLQGIQVLAIGSQSIADDQYQDKEAGALAQRGQMNFRQVTLLVDPKQAEIVQLAMQAGSVSLSMRNPLDAEHESRRLTRAREISPDGGVATLLSMSGDDPFNETPATPKVAVKKAVAPSPPPAPNAWETIIIRGKNSSTRTFPFPVGAAPAATNSESIEPAASTTAPPSPSPDASGDDDPTAGKEPIEVGAGG
jgi:pilus assembly protein CpaB